MTRYIVGLGNPGDTYKKTRHNVGFMFLDFLNKSEESVWTKNKKGRFVSTDIVFAGNSISLLKPETMMNRSGEAVRYIMAKERVKPEDIVIVHDDIDLPVGTYKISEGRGSGGHRGVESIFEATGTHSFPRVRIGITPVSFFGNIKKPKGKSRVSSFVLSDFTNREHKKIEQVFLELKKSHLEKNIK